jgi:hypothetical protein
MSRMLSMGKKRRNRMNMRTSGKVNVNVRPSPKAES